MGKTVTEKCAQAVLEVVPRVMCSLRAQMRSGRGPSLTVPQFRVLAFISRNPGASLSQAAQHLGVSLPTVSRLVDGLVSRGLVTREVSGADRRCVSLALTAQGRSLLAAARQQTQAYLAQNLEGISNAEQMAILEAMSLLAALFASDKRG